MAGRVIQGFFIGGGRLAPVPAPLPGPAAVQRFATRSSGPPPGPPQPAFARAGGQVVQQRPAPGRPPLVHVAPTAAAPAGGRSAPAPAPAPVLQRFGGDGSFAIDPGQVGLARSGGMPLPRVLLARMEAAFGADFSGVRVHVGPQAARIGALAFTTGNDLYFAPGQYQPDSVRGRQLIGHELAHVVQQRQGRVRAPAAEIAVVQDRALEAEADRLGMKAASGASLPAAPVQAQPRPGGYAPGALHRLSVVQRAQGEKRKREQEDDAPPPQSEPEKKRLRLASPSLFPISNARYTEFGPVKQTDLNGEGGRSKQNFFTIASTGKKVNKPNAIRLRYIKEGKIHSYMKVNGGFVNYGMNEAGGPSLTFNMGYRYQGDKKYKNNGTDMSHHKVNPHGEDWTTTGFRTEFERSSFAGKDNGLADWLKSNNFPVSGNTGRPDTHVISIWINYSSCLGCATTIENFHTWLSTQLGNDFLLRVKFLRPHDLMEDASSAQLDTAKNFISSIGRLRAKGIHVRMQPVASAEKVLKRVKLKYSEDEKTRLAVNHSGVKNILTEDQYAYLTQSWTNMGVNRKQPSVTTTTSLN